MMNYLQRLGKSLMLPVAVLPVAAILMGIGYWIDPTGWGANSQLAAFLLTAGGAIVDNMAILFAIGVAVGMSKDQNGAAGLAGLVSWLTVTTILKPAKLALLWGSSADVSKVLDEKAISGLHTAVEGATNAEGLTALSTAITKLAPALAPTSAIPVAFTKIETQFTGILCGLIAAACYNKFKDTKLPDFLSFFSGRRSVAIVTALVSALVAFILMYAWPPIYSGLVSFGEGIVSLGAIGAGIYGFLNRLLIPIGLHHALNSVFWFDVAGISDISRFWGATPLLEQTINGTSVTGIYMTGFFPVMMFGLPGAALAMYHTAKSNKKKVAAGILFSAALSSFFTGVTEPIEFAFMFLAPALYLVHAILTGISLAVLALFPVRAGFNFSAGFVDWFLSFQAPGAKNGLALLAIGLVVFVIYYVVFRFLITKFNFKTPGREDDDIDPSELTIAPSNSNYADTASKLMIAVGGKDNVLSIDNCVTRLRLEIKDLSKVDEKAIKATGVAGVIRPGGNALQIIVGTTVEHVAEEFKKI
ncbi:MAG: PTS transporter subunit EIIC [Gemella sp.]|nr:PTS transporter subunit EIIC [Gemella sp.]